MLKQRNADKNQVCKGSWIRPLDQSYSWENSGSERLKVSWNDPPAVTLKESVINQRLQKYSHSITATVSFSFGLVVHTVYDRGFVVIKTLLTPKEKNINMTNVSCGTTCWLHWCTVIFSVCFASTNFITPYFHSCINSTFTWINVLPSTVLYIGHTEHWKKNIENSFEKFDKPKHEKNNSSTH